MDAGLEPRATRAARVIAVAGLLYALSAGLLALAVWVDLPGPLASYGDPRAAWPVALTLAAGATAFGTWRWAARRSPRPFAVVLLGLGVATVLVCASASYARCPDPGLARGWSVVTRVVGLITNNYAVDMFAQPGCVTDGVPLALQFARLVQLVVVLVAFTSALTALLRTQVDRLAVRFSPRVSLVIGADTASAALLPALAQDAGRATLAVVAPDPLAPWVATARAAGWRVVVTDPHRPGVLERLLVRGRRHSLARLAVLAADSTEVQRVVARVFAVVDERRPVVGREPVRALLRMDEAWQAEDWRRRYLAEVPDWVVDTISENEVTARLLVDHLLERGVDRLVLTGRSDLTFALLAELAQREREGRLAEASVPVPAVVLADPAATEVVEEHTLAQARFGNGRLDRLSAVPDEELDDAPDRALDDLVTRELADLPPGDLAALVFTAEADPADQRRATRLGATHPELLVYSRHTEVSGLGEAPLLAQVRAYGTTLAGGPGRPVDSWERIARLVHEDYARRFPDPDNPARRPWAELDAFYRESNVRQVLTVLGSAVEVGRSWGASSTAATPVTEAQLEEMARREHDSWRHHLERAGRTHPDLRAWADLPEASRAKTRAGVTESLALLATLGYRSFDDPYRQWHTFRRRGEVDAVRRDADWTWTTAGGARMRGEAGDWEVTDDGGATRSVAAGIFESTHAPLGGDRWARVGEVQGRMARPGEVVRSLEGEQTARAGQWVLRGAAGEEWLVSGEHLAATYDETGARA